MTPLFLRLSALACGFVLDMLLGDPHHLPHPVRAIGSLISASERFLRGILPKTPDGELIGGGVLVFLCAGIPTLFVAILRMLLAELGLWAVFVLDVLLSYQLLAARSLRDESMKVYTELRSGDIERSRYAVSMIVGRDTQRLNETGIIKATVETVAENTSDGVIAPLIFLALGGTPLGMFYKACSTMDSMVGYKNERYLYFGRAAARLDDLLNFIPARLTGVLLCLAAVPLGMDFGGAWRIFLRDRLKHKSPNAAHPEAACAGALGIELAGPAYYFSRLVDKPAIGDKTRPICAEDIPAACRLMYTSAVMALLIFCVAPLILIYNGGMQ